MMVQGTTKTVGERRAMVDNQIRTFDVTDQRVLEAFGRIPREIFLDPKHVVLAYSDATLVVRGDGPTRRTMLIPMVLARMIQGLDVTSADRALVVAGGTGYPAAILATLCSTVVAVEIDEALRNATRRNASALGLDNVAAEAGSLTAGHPARAPYDVVLICGAIEQEPSALLEQLPPGGRLVVIEAESHEATRRSGKVTRYERTGSEISSRVLFDATAPVLDGFAIPASFVF